MVMVPVSVGELVDKITILEIKRERIGDEGKRANVERELQALVEVFEQAVGGHELDWHRAGLRAVNEALWEIEDRIRRCEGEGDFGERFIELARAVYHENDRRAELKRAINEATGSALVEEKCYADYCGEAPPPRV